MTIKIKNIKIPKQNPPIDVILAEANIKLISEEAAPAKLKVPI